MQLVADFFFVPVLMSVNEGEEFGDGPGHDLEYLSLIVNGSIQQQLEDAELLKQFPLLGGGSYEHVSQEKVEPLLDLEVSLFGMFEEQVEEVFFLQDEDAVLGVEDHVGEELVDVLNDIFLLFVPNQIEEVPVFLVVQEEREITHSDIGEEVVQDLEHSLLHFAIREQVFVEEPHDLTVIEKQHGVEVGASHVEDEIHQVFLALLEIGFGDEVLASDFQDKIRELLQIFSEKVQILAHFHGDYREEPDSRPENVVRLQNQRPKPLQEKLGNFQRKAYVSQLFDCRCDIRQDIQYHLQALRIVFVYELEFSEKQLQDVVGDVLDGVLFFVEEIGQQFASHVLYLRIQSGAIELDYLVERLWIVGVEDVVEEIGVLFALQVLQKLELLALTQKENILGAEIALLNVVSSVIHRAQSTSLLLTELLDFVLSDFDLKVSELFL